MEATKAAKTALQSLDISAIPFLEYSLPAQEQQPVGMAAGKLVIDKRAMMATLFQAMDALLNARQKTDGHATQLFRRQNPNVREPLAELAHVEMESSKPT